MPSKPSIFATIVVGLTASLIFGCAPRNSTNFRPQPTPVIQKGTKTTPQIATQNDQILLAFNELGWARQTAALSVFPASVSTQEGCVIRRPSTSGSGTGYFLTEDYRCERMSDEFDLGANQRHVMNGRQLYSQASGLFQTFGSFAAEIWQGNSLVARGSSTRRTQISIPGGALGTTQVNDAALSSSVFKMTSNGEYRGEAPELRTAEQWTSNVTSGFVFTASKPLTLLTGSQVSLSYLPETVTGTKRSAQIIQLTALSDLTYAEVDNCLRPIGTFALSNGMTQVGTLTTTQTGYSISTETNQIHVWGKRCLER
jgi:hypothetical protein